MKNIVKDHCESQKIFGDTQSAYRKHRCTKDNFIELTQHVSEAFQRSEVAGLLGCRKSVRCCKAPRRKNHKLNSIGLNHSVIRWIKSFLLKGNVFVNIISTVSDSFSPTAVIIQVSIIASFLYLQYISLFASKKAQISLFADSFSSTIDKITPKKQLQSSLSSLIDCCDSLKFKINPNKTHNLIFKNH